MKKRLLALVLSCALLLSVCAAGFTVSAEADFELIPWTTDTIVSVDDNLLKPDMFSANYSALDGCGGVDILNDGIYSIISGPDHPENTVSERWDYRSWDANMVVWITYDLGGKGTIETVGFMSDGASGENTTKVYVEDVPFGAISAAESSYTPVAYLDELSRGTGFALKTPKEGRYVTFRFTPSKPYNYTVLLSELCATGEPPKEVEKKPKYEAITTDNIPTGNLLTKAVVTDANTNSTPSLWAGTPLAAAFDGHYQGVDVFGDFVATTEQKTVNDVLAEPFPGMDGYYYDYEAWGYSKVSGADQYAIFNFGAGVETSELQGLTFDLGAYYAIEKLSLGSMTSPKAFRIGQAPLTEDALAQFRARYDSATVLSKGEVYVAENKADLYEEENKVLSFDYSGDLSKALNQLWTLPETVEGRFVGFKLPVYYTNSTNLMSVAELGAFGEKTRDSEDADLVNLIAGKSPVKEYLSMPLEPGRPINGQDPMVVHVGEIEALTDGDLSSPYEPSIIRSAYWPMFHLLEFTLPDKCDGGMVSAPGLPHYVVAYYLGGTCQINRATLTSLEEAGYYIAGCDFYVSQKLADLFKPESLAYTTNGNKVNPSKTEEFDPSTDVKARQINAEMNTPVTGRYIAFVVTRPSPANVRGYGILRFAELSATGKMLEQDEVFDSARRTVKDEATGIEATISQIDNDDTAFFDGLSLKVEVKDLPASVKRTTFNNLLTVDSKAYTLTLMRNGVAVTEQELGTRYWELKFPTKAGYYQVLARLGADGQLTRVRNSQTNITNDYVIAGNNYAQINPTSDHFADADTIYGNGMTFVVMRFTDINEAKLLNNETLNEGIVLSKTAGAADASSTPVWAWIPVALAFAGAGVCVLLVFRRRKEADAQ